MSMYFYCCFIFLGPILKEAKKIFQLCDIESSSPNFMKQYDGLLTETIVPEEIIDSSSKLES